ncbi:hypothetical protein [Pararhizobium sp. PWRC1-1]|uniref:hypothetical protein n=1 Tax=Pararhizobium sp. PWRC1-1 TaxID=2804566 RepID=UPI003CF74AE8
MINEPKYPVSHEDRNLACQEEVDGPLQIILDQANTHGWGTIETISAMEEVLKNMRIAYAEHPDPAEEMDEIDPHPSGDPDPSNDWPGANP